MSKALTGKWQWNGVIKPMNAGDEHMLHYLWFKSGFTSNGQSFEGIRLTYDDFWKLEYDTGSGYVEAGTGYYGDNSAEPFEQYRVIDFGTGSKADDDSDGTFVAWFLSNVTRYGTVADKLVQIAENEKAVYQSGYDKALEKGGYDEGFDAGKQAEYDAFWDAFQNNGNRIVYAACFGGDNWNNGLLNPKYTIKPASAIYMFYRNSMGGDLVEYFENIEKVLSFEGAVSRNLNSTFDSSQFTRVGKIHSTDASWYTTFNNCSKLVTIDEVGNPAENGNAQFQSSTFNGCTALKNITIVGWIVNSTNFSSSKQLTRASIESIVNHLSDTASGKTLTLSITAVATAFGGGAFDSDGDGKNDTVMGSGDWVDLVNSKPNWKITLV